MMKNNVLKIVKSALAGAEDNLYRAEMQFGNMTADELGKQYGQSGKTCGEILGGYRDKQDELAECVKWVESKK